jgi:hypothetical protein
MIYQPEKRLSLQAYEDGKVGMILMFCKDGLCAARY